MTTSRPQAPGHDATMHREMLIVSTAMSNPNRSTVVASLAWVLVPLGVAVLSLLSPACAKKTQDANEPAWTQSSSEPLAQRSTKTLEKHDPAWAACHQSFKPKGKSLEADVSAMAKGCEAVTKMKPMGATITGQQDAKSQPHLVPLKAEAGKCYRVYAASSGTVGDLDLVLRDSRGDIASEDTTDDPSPVIAEDGAVCFKDADAASVVVSIGAGKGSYALEIWSD